MKQMSLSGFFNIPKAPSTSPPTSLIQNLNSENPYPAAAAAVDIQDSVGDAPNPSLASKAHRPERGLFASFADLVADIRAKGGRDAFVANLASNRNLYGSTRDTSRRSNTGDKDGIIYAIVNLANRKCYVGQTKNFDIRMSIHFSQGKGGYKTYIKRAINKHGQEKFMSVILLAGIEKQKELDLTEIGVIKYLDCLAPENRGYNIHAGGRGGPQSAEHRKRISDGSKGKLCASLYKAVVVTFLSTDVRTTYLSAKAAAKEMGVSKYTISNLTNKRIKKSKSKCGDYAGQLFTARFRD